MYGQELIQLGKVSFLAAPCMATVYIPTNSSPKGPSLLPLSSLDRLKTEKENMSPVTFNITLHTVGPLFILEQH